MNFEEPNMITQMIHRMNKEGTLSDESVEKFQERNKIMPS